MTVTAIGPYEFKSRDHIDNFHGSQVVYWHWEEHLMFCAAIALLLPRDMPFGDVLNNVLPGCYGMHPQFAQIDWSKVVWMLDGRPFKPDLSASLGTNGVGHKSLLRFWTPGLHGLSGAVI